MRQPIPSQADLVRETLARETRQNQIGAKVVWQHFITDLARIKLKWLYPVVKKQNL